MSRLVSVNDLKPDIREVVPLGFGQQRIQDCAADTFAPSVGKNTQSRDPPRALSLAKHTKANDIVPIPCHPRFVQLNIIKQYVLL